MRKKNYYDNEWKKNPNAVYVGRPSKWGNPYPVSGPYSTRYNLEESLTLYRIWLKQKLEKDPDFLESLRGKDLVCFCSLDQPCHADIITEYLNLTKPIHCHTGEFGSELWCPECNPICHDKHNSTKLNWCGHQDCPMNPNRFIKQNKCGLKNCGQHNLSNYLKAKFI